MSVCACVHLNESYLCLCAYLISNVPSCMNHYVWIIDCAFFRTLVQQSNQLRIIQLCFAAMQRCFTTFFCYSWLLVLCVLTPAPATHTVASYSAGCRKFDAFNQHEQALSIIVKEVPVAVRNYLGWTTAEKIMQSLHQPRSLQWAEVFCGTGTLSNQLSKVMPRGKSLDTAIGGTCHDILTVQGYALFLRVVLALVPFALCWLAPPCSLWVFLSTGVHKRSSLRSSGDTSRKDVRDANLIVHRCRVLVHLMSVRLVQWIMEQPVTSLMFRYASFLKVQSRQHCIFGLELQRKFVWLGAWGGQLHKPTALWGIAAVLDQLHSVRPQLTNISIKKTTKKVVKRNGKDKVVYRIYGVRKLIKQSQVYPERFCKEFAGRVHRIYQKSVECLF